MSKLKSERVEEIFQDCLFKDEEVVDGKPIVEPAVAQGVLMTVGLHPDRLASHKAEILAMLDELPIEFKPQDLGGGDGYSFLNACNDKNGEQWTSFHRRMDELFMLGIAVGGAKCMAPKMMWPMLPGGMPYYMVDPRGGLDAKGGKKVEDPTKE